MQIKNGFAFLDRSEQTLLEKALGRQMGPLIPVRTLLDLVTERADELEAQGMAVWARLVRSVIHVPKELKADLH